MIPKTSDELYSFLFLAALSRAYGDIATAARRRRLTEHDIAGIERKVLAFRQDAEAFAEEFETFETEPVVARVFKELEQFFAHMRAARIKEIS